MVRIKGEVGGLKRPRMALTVFNGVQGWYHDGHVSAAEARDLAAKLNAWADATWERAYPNGVVDDRAP